MPKTDEKQQLDLIATYYKEPGSRSKILAFFLEHFKEEIDHQCKLAKVTITHPRERDSEAIFALINSFETIQQHPNLSLTDTFRNGLRRSLRNNLAIKKNHIEISGLSIADPNGSPEDQYILKEQMELLKDFIRDKYDATTLYQFQLQFLDGWNNDEIALEFGVTGRSVAKKLATVYERAQRYMRRINNE